MIQCIILRVTRQATFNTLSKMFMSCVKGLPKYGVIDHGDGFPCLEIVPVYRATCIGTSIGCLIIL